jgi:hypothetical protein
MMKKLSIGVSDFEEIISQKYYFVDKSGLIKEIVDSGAKVTLIPRPRRFGKTLNMTMLQCFFEKTEKSKRNLFDGLKISKESNIMTHQGQYPIIYLTFKDVKQNNWDDCYDKVRKVISSEFSRHKYLYESDALSEFEKKSFYSVLEGSASRATLENSLKDLSTYLHKHHNKKPIILIDEYDMPIIAGFTYDYYEEIISFMRGYLCGGLKDNRDLSFAVMTGILRVAKESIFSGLNNLEVCSITNDTYADKFGFLESEVRELVDYFGCSGEMDDVRKWYNGYSSGENHTVYNPWSIINFVKNRGRFGAYWVNTSDNKIIQELIRKSSEDVKRDFELIFAKKPVNKTICEDIVFSEIYRDSNALWSFLVFSGYLTWQSLKFVQAKCRVALVVPNDEVLYCLKTLVERWFSESMGSSIYENMLEALSQGNISAFERYFQQNIVDSMSYFDVTKKNPERVYHAYVLGMLVGLSATHEVKSNRESGFGRYDVCLIPNDTTKPGTVIEFKAFNEREDKDINIAAQKALVQIEERQYEAELLSRGIKKIIKLAIVFEGKKVLIISETNF